MIPESINVSRQLNKIQITWDSNKNSSCDLISLRQSCPCATCCQERGENPHPSLLENTIPKTGNQKKSISLPLLGNTKKFEVVSMHHVGNYALGITWEDKHSSIYTWEFLHQSSNNENQR